MPQKRTDPEQRAELRSVQVRNENSGRTTRFMTGDRRTSTFLPESSTRLKDSRNAVIPLARDEQSSDERGRERARLASDLASIQCLLCCASRGGRLARGKLDLKFCNRAGQAGSVRAVSGYGEAVPAARWRCRSAATHPAALAADVHRRSLCCCRCRRTPSAPSPSAPAA